MRAKGCRGRRKRLLVHRGVQGFLLLRVLLYVGAATVFMLAALVLWQLAARGPARLFHNHLADIWRQYAPVFLTLGLLVPLFLYDMLRVSHRVVGPLVRLHRSMEALGRGQPVEKLQFRQDDFLHELAEAFNLILQRYQPQRPKEHAPQDCAATQTPREVAATASQGGQ